MSTKFPAFFLSFFFWDTNGKSIAKSEPVNPKARGTPNPGTKNHTPTKGNYYYCKVVDSTTYLYTHP
jgi:hypothetical protein